MREDALDRLGDGGIGCNVTSTEDNYGGDNLTFRRIRGTITTPQYLLNPDEPPSLMSRDDDGNPLFTGYSEVPFTMIIPQVSADNREWNDYKPYFNYLLTQELNELNVKEWMKYWSDLSELIGEVGTRVYVATTVDTTDEGAKKRFYSFLENISENASSKNQILKKKLEG